MDKLAVALVTQWFPPEPVTVPVWLTRSLCRAGLDVRVLTGMPNYPDGRRHPGFPVWGPMTNHVEGRLVRRTPLFASHSRSPIPRFLNYGTWAMSASLAGKPAFRNVDVSLVYSSPATAALPAMWQRIRNGVPYVLMVQDVWPDSIFATGFLSDPVLRRLSEGLLNRFVDRTYSHAHHVAVIAPGMKELLVSRGVPAEKVSVVFNWVDEAEIRQEEPHDRLRAQLGLSRDDLLVMYAGNHGPAQSLSTLIAAARRLGPGSRVHLVLVGEGIEREALREASAGLPNVHFLPAVPVTEMPELMAGSDIQVVSLRDEPLFRITLPGKLQSIMASGRPMLVVAPGDAAAVMNAAGAGLAVSPGDVTGVAEALVQLRDTGRDKREAMGKAGRTYYLNQMSEAVGSQRLAALLRDAAVSRRRPG